MKSLPLSLLSSALPALLCIAAAPVQASVVSITQERLFNMVDTLALNVIGPPDYPAGNSGGTSTNAMKFVTFDSLGNIGSLVGAHWELDMIYSIELFTNVRSLSTNPNEAVTALSNAEVLLYSTVLNGTNGQMFQAHTDTYGQCTTTLALGLCSIEGLVQGSLSARIDVADLAAFIGDTPIEEHMSLVDSVGHFPTAGPLSMSTHAVFLAMGADATKGALRLVYDYEDGSVPGSVPEPGSLALAGMGLAALWHGRRARRAATRLPQ